MAPFDLSSVSFPDSRGPSYQLRGIVREKAIAGSRVTVAAAKGKKGKRFRTLGKGKVNSEGVFKVRFRLSRGTYRIRLLVQRQLRGHQGHRLRGHHDSPGDPLARTQRRRYSRRSITVVRVPGRRQAVQPRREPRVGVQVHRRGRHAARPRAQGHAVDGEAHPPAPQAIS